MEEKQPHASEEIDLLYFLRPITNALKKTGHFLHTYYKSLVGNRILFIVIVVLITSAGFLLRYIIPPAYETEAILVSHELPGKYCAMLITNLNELKKTKNIPLLAQQLQISNESASKIRSIVPTQLNDSFTINGRDTSLAVFSVQLITYDTHDIDTIQKGLIQFLENNPFAIKRKEAKLQSLMALKNSLNLKLKSLDSLKIIVNNSIIPRSEGKGIILGQPVDPVDIYQAETGYYKDQLDVNEQLSIMDNIEVIQPFFKLNEYNYPKFKYLEIGAFLFALIVALIFTPLLGRKPRHA